MELVQIFLDTALILLVIFLIAEIRKWQSVKKQAKEFMSSMENFLKESNEIAQQFEKNMNEKNKLIRKLLAELDEKIEEARIYLDKLRKYSEINPKPQMLEKFENEVLILHKQGFGVNEIAQRLNKPRDEIELILNLKKTNG